MAATKKTAKVEEPVTELTMEEKYKQELDELKNQMALLLRDAAKPVETQENLNDPDRDIVVISLTRGILNLSTEGHGHGEVYRFNQFGEEMTIPYSDLKKIINKNKSFTVNGNYYIYDETVIEKQRLKKAYEKIVSKEQFEELFALPKDKFLGIFNKMMKAQQLMFSEILIDKLVDKEDIDANIINAVADITGKKIYEIVEGMNKTKEIAKG